MKRKSLVLVVIGYLLAFALGGCSLGDNEGLPTQTPSASPGNPQPTEAAAMWTRTFGGKGTDVLNSVALAPGGGFFAAGYTTSVEGDFVARHGDDNSDGVVARFASDGSLVWAKVLGGSDADIFTSVAVCDDGSIVVVGSTYSFDGDFPAQRGSDGSDAVVVRLSFDGSVVWAKSFGGSDADEFEAVTAVTGGAVVAVGDTMSTDGDFPVAHGEGACNAVAAKVSADGALVWAKTYGGTGVDGFNAVTLVSGENVIAAGHAFSSDGDFPVKHTGSADAVIVRLSAEGNVTWAKTFGGDGEDSLFAVTLASDDGVIGGGVLGSTDGPFYKTLMTHFTLDGVVTWTKSFGGGATDRIMGLTTTSDGQILAVGDASSSNGDFPVAKGHRSDALIFEVSADGVLNWAKTYGGSGDDFFSAAVILPDGDIVAVGDTDSNGGDFSPTRGDSDALVAQLTSDGELGPS